MILSAKDVWRLKHMLDAIAEIEQCVAKKSEGRFIHLATERLVQNVGEMARAASGELKSSYPEIPWTDIVGMRHILVHEYYRVDKETLWDVAEHKIPALKDWITGILKKHEGRTS